MLTGNIHEKPEQPDLSGWEEWISRTIPRARFIGLRDISEYLSGNKSTGPRSERAAAIHLEWHSDIIPSLQFSANQDRG
jgi:hypothetical protein